MDTVKQEGVLSCSICGKIFNHARVKTRHMSYCRKKHNATLATRKKSCERCIQSKTRCIRVEQGCSRCVSKNWACSFILKHSLPYSDNLPDLNSMRPDEIAIPEMTSFDPYAAITLYDANSKTKQLPAIMDTVHRDDTYMYLTKVNQNSPSQDLSLTETSDIQVEPPAIRSSKWQDNNWHAQGILSPASTEILFQLPLEIPFKESSSMLSKRKFLRSDYVMNSELATQMLRSYPSMLKNNGSLPPFIHIQTSELVESGITRPNPIHTVVSILEMFQQSHTTNRPFIWQLIQMEHERLWREYQNFGKWELLSAMQEVVVHVLLRIVEGPQEYINCDTQMLCLINILCSLIREKYGELLLTEELRGEIVSWQDWIFAESRRRTVTIVKIINTIFHADLSIPCPKMPEYKAAPLPSHQSLWGAYNELNWNIEYFKNIRQSGPHGMLSNGDLVELKSGVSYQKDRKLDWDNWYAGADTLGILVMIAANLA